MKIVHIISGLDTGGAELMLFKLVCHLNSQEHIVISLTSFGTVGRKLINAGFKVYSLNFNKFNFIFRFIFLIRLLGTISPDVVQTWLYHSDLIGGLAARFAGVKKVFWNIRNTEIPQGIFSSTKLVILLCSLLSFLVPNKIICCADAAKYRHIDLHYNKKKLIVIPNGFILDEADSTFIHRSSLRIPDDFFIIGVVGRYDYLKGYDVLIKAASILSKITNIKFTFVCIGRGVDLNNQNLKSEIKLANLHGNFMLLGEVEDVIKYYQLFDCFCLPSRSEGFPNVLAEAMLASLPCVTTNVGDAASIIDSYGIVVPPNDCKNLALGIREIIEMPNDIRKAMGYSAKLSIMNRFGLEIISNEYLKVYNDE